jgi:hypothetical protein
MRLPVLRGTGTEQLNILWVTSAWPFSAALFSVWMRGWTMRRPCARGYRVLQVLCRGIALATHPATAERVRNVHLGEFPPRNKIKEGKKGAPSDPALPVPVHPPTARDRISLTRWTVHLDRNLATRKRCAT